MSEISVNMDARRRISKCISTSLWYNKKVYIPTKYLQDLKDFIIYIQDHRNILIK